MSRWFRAWLGVWKHEPWDAETQLQRTIDQLRTCRFTLVRLMEEARLVQQMLGSAEESVVKALDGTKVSPRHALEPRVFTVEDRQR